MTQSILILSMVALVGVSSCEDESLPNANAQLNIISNLSVINGHELALLEWIAPEIGMPSGYRVTWSPGDGSVDLDNTQLSYTIKGIENGVTYDAGVQAVYNEGVSGKQEVSLAPKDELNFNIFPGSGFVIAKWAKPAREDVAGYELSWTPDGEIPVSLGKDELIYQANGLRNDEEYAFELFVVYAEGKSVSEVSLSTTPGKVTAYTTNPEKPISNQEIFFAFNPAFLPQSTAVSFAWDFGDGITSEEQEPAHTYLAPGMYTVKLTVEDNDGLTYIAESDLKVIGEIWSFDTGDEIRSSSPVVGADGTVYVGGDTDLVYAFNTDGTVKWTFDTGGDVDCSPSLGTDGTVYIGSQGGKFHALNPADGTEKWSITAQSVDFFFSTPAIGTDGSIYIGCRDGNLYALNPDGSAKWTYTTTNQIRGSVAIGDLGDIYIANDDGNLYALQESDGGVTWTVDIGGRDEGGIALGADGTIYIGTGNDGDQLLALDPTDGTTKWAYQAGADILAAPVVDASGVIYAASRDGNVYAINSDGSLKWISSFTEFRGSAAIGEDGTIYVGHYGEVDPGLYALSPEDGTVQSYFATGRVWSSPAISNGKLYFGSFDFKFYAVEMFAGSLQSSSVWPMKSKDIQHTSRQ